MKLSAREMVAALALEYWSLANWLPRRRVERQYLTGAIFARGEFARGRRS